MEESLRNIICVFRALSSIGGAVATLRSRCCRGRSGTRTLNFTQPCRLAFEATEVEQLGAPYAVGANHFNLIEHLGVKREDALDAMAEADLADGDARLGPFATGNHCSFEGLNAFFIAFFDLDLDADGIARSHLRNIFALQTGSKLFHNRVLRHVVSF